MPCSDFMFVSSHDNTVVVGRTMDYWLNLNPHVVVVPPGRKYQSSSPIEECDNKNNGLSWQTIYGFVGIQPINMPTLENIVIDGMNEKGLAFAMLALNSEYPTITFDKKETALEIGLFGAWILGLHATVEEIKTNIQKINIWSPNYKPFNAKLEMHFAVHDANGKNLVIEFTNGGVQIFDNEIGVLTNDPVFPKQLAHLAEYQSSIDLEQFNINGFDIINSSISRFIKLATIINLIKKSENKKSTNKISAVVTAFHILNTIDIPIGTSITYKLGKVYDNYTQWSTVKDLTNKIYYWRSYDDLKINQIVLRKYI
ncbi:linear amide C-N hydrolase [Tupanvirus soda lake]|uniref:Linear amide C-N hydrolase n=2 Tax=Tupanvirus TaxID=2094720 RepID=A0A6N1NTL8_9VIRU|nr:linear amide C-N hydrolase [Tupanvirus soda lake]QKU35737.1 linear amide C-N hydrolase [Tupanvirus soda lake]